MARKAIVDRDTVLQLLRDGKTSQSIASQFGVSRQAIDLYRKEFVSSGVLEQRVIRYHATEIPVSPSGQAAPAAPSPAATDKAASTAAVSVPQVAAPPTMPPPVPQTRQSAPRVITKEITLDQMIDLLIKAFDAMKQVPEMEKEMAKLRQDYTAALGQIEQLQAREQKRKEQEARWIHAQQI